MTLEKKQQRGFSGREVTPSNVRRRLFYTRAELQNSEQRGMIAQAVRWTAYSCHVSG